MNKPKGWEYVPQCACPTCEEYRLIMPPLVPELSAQRLVDEFGFPLVAPEKVEIALDDWGIVKESFRRFLDEDFVKSTQDLRDLRDLYRKLP